ncbi:hypothetical protein QSV08_09820 [Maribacter sp. BPC-D8]|uniref:hypothetical protein n=1 Tax=Maribacter sp. BPC-D8 TaxID=3053613 RepID=UPI002B49C167|nr:hypothetical protein [Maribacter sp. BPC-D8]WRI31533.1 hypothetical protein QSV08_09820 [Maribacter sp. BPC-D8]
MKSLLKAIPTTILLILLFFLIGFILFTQVGRSNPYYVTTKPIIVKKLEVPTGTKLVYEGHFFKEKQQDEMMNEENLIEMEFPNHNPIYWAGDIPVYSIYKYYNSAMRGFSVNGILNQANKSKETEFTQLWHECNDDGLGVSVKNMNDWSFNVKNIEKIEDCNEIFEDYLKEAQSH